MRTGRPKVKDARQVVVGVRLTTAEKRAYEAAACEKEVTVSNWIRATCNASLNRNRR